VNQEFFALSIISPSCTFLTGFKLKLAASAGVLPSAMWLYEIVVDLDSVAPSLPRFQALEAAHGLRPHAHCLDPEGETELVKQTF